MNWFIEQARWFWPDWFITAWAWGTLVIGTSFLAIAAVTAVEHTLLGHPLIDGRTNRPMARGEAVLWLLSFGSAGAIFALLGLLTHRAG